MKYIVHPNWARKADGNFRWVGFEELCELYLVNPTDCYNALKYYPSVLESLTGLEHLRVRADGDYPFNRLCKNIEQAKPKTIQAKFEKYHELNPEVYTNLVRMTRQLHERGRKKISISMLIEILRWNYYLETVDPDSDFKISNDYRSRYARKIAIENPDLAHMFAIRELKTP